MTFEWKLTTEEDTKHPTISADVLFWSEMAVIWKAVNDAEFLKPPVEREGFMVSVQGSCCKGPQGTNWKVEIEFEFEVARDQFLAVHKALGDAEGSAA